MLKRTKSLEERLQAHPQLKQQLLELLEQAEGGIQSADKVEELVVQSIQGMGRQGIQDWAEQQEAASCRALREADAEVHANGKKNSTG
jgi:hypothetical protein